MSIFRDFLDKENFQHVIYTDRSKKQDMAGFEGVLNVTGKISKLLTYPFEKQSRKLLIATDSTSGKNDIGLKIAQLLGTDLTLIWVHRHLDFPGNDPANRTAQFLFGD